MDRTMARNVKDCRSRKLRIEHLESRQMLVGDFELLKDINAFSEPLGSDPAQLLVIGEVLYFTANDGATGVELWKSDGTAAGTVLVKDIRPGGLGSAPSNLTNFGGTLYFSANDGVRGHELWKSDGTAAGTICVKDVESGPGNSYPRHLTNVDGTLFFTRFIRSWSRRLENRWHGSRHDVGQTQSQWSESTARFYER